MHQKQNKNEVNLLQKTQISVVRILEHVLCALDRATLGLSNCCDQYFQSQE